MGCPRPGPASRDTAPVVRPVRALVAGAVLISASVGCRSAGPSAAERPAATLPPITASPGATSPTGTGGTGAVEHLRYEVVAAHPHDPEAFTEGLLLDPAGRLFESVGRYKRSDVRTVDLVTGEVARRQENDPAHFGEGLALVGDRLIQLTWKEHTALFWAKDDLSPQGSATYDTEGWGLCYDGDRLVMSDGSARLTFRDPVTLAARGQVTVTRAGRPLPKLNELECVAGKVYANVWQTNAIVVIDPVTGQVTAELDLTDLLPKDQRAGADVLNGIAYKADSGTFLVTGKLWPTLFELRVS